MHYYERKNKVEKRVKRFEIHNQTNNQDHELPTEIIITPNSRSLFASINSSSSKSNSQEYDVLTELKSNFKSLHNRQS